MQYTFETGYNKKTLSVMARCIRKTVRKSRSKRSHIFGWIVIVLAMLLSFRTGEEGFALSAKNLVTWAAVLVMLLTLLFEDSINGYFAGRRMLKGTETAVSFFDTENRETFRSETPIGKSEFSYQSILLICETKQFFVFVFSSSHAQIYDKATLSGGSVESFRDFLTGVTGKSIVNVT